MALAKTGFTATTPDSFVIDTAVLYTAVTYDSANTTWTGTLVGSTSGGVKVDIKKSYRKPEVDGTYITNVVGLEVLDSATCDITYTTKELTAEAVRQALNGTSVAGDGTTAPTTYEVITSKKNVDATDYIPTFAVVGTWAGSSQPIIFMLDNGLVTNDFSAEMKDKDEAGVQQTVSAHATFAQLAADEFPWRIYHPNTTV